MQRLVLGRRGYYTNSHGAREQLSIGGSDELSSNLHASSFLSIPSDLHISHPLGLGSIVNTETPSRSLSVMTADLCLGEDGELVSRVDSETSFLKYRTDANQHYCHPRLPTPSFMILTHKNQVVVLALLPHSPL